MFELKYTVTENDFATENKRIALFYFLLYGIVAVIGLAAGIAAVVLRPQQLMFALGIVLLVLSGILMLCALFIIIAPKNYVKSAAELSGGEMNVTVDKHGITIDGEVATEFVDMTRIKRRKEYLLAYVNKDEAYMIKNTLGERFSELYSYMDERKGRILLTEKPTAPSDKETGETAENADGANNAPDEGSAEYVE